MTALALFDLDGTLLEGDTDALWCEYLMRKEVIARAEFEPRNRDTVERYAAGGVTAAEFCAFYASILAGRSRLSWEQLRDRFVTQVIVPRLRPAGQAKVDEHRAAGDRCVLTTATNDLLTPPIAGWLGFEPQDLIATGLEEQGGLFTGRNAGVLNMREGKVTRLAAWLEAQGIEAGALAGASFYSDSINDLALLQAVAQPVAVDPDAKLRAEAAARGWPVTSFAASANAADSSDAE